MTEEINGLAEKYDEVKYEIETPDGAKTKVADDYEVQIRVVHFFHEDEEEIDVETVPIDRIYKIEHIRKKNEDDDDE